ncbi:MAG: hypothetical protein L6R00_21220 [Phycisphaerae bacterium]|nr:hypothetical protein [Phycisphaerae bacterium]
MVKCVWNGQEKLTVVSTELQYRLLDALRYLDFEGARLVNVQHPTVIRFGKGIPKVFLRAWLDWLPPRVNDVVKLADRRGLITVQLGNLFETMLPWGLPGRDRTRVKLIFARPDGKHAVIQWTPLAPSGFVVIAAGGDLDRDGTLRSNAFIPRIKPNATEQLIRISGDGLKWLESGSGCSTPGDELVTLSQVAPLTGRTKRTLERYIRSGQLPAPDVHGGQGVANRWRWSTLRPALEKVSKRLLPEQFPGSRIM